MYGLSGVLYTLVLLVVPCVLVSGNPTIPNFVAQDDLLDGQHEIRIHYNGVTAKQTSVGVEQGSASGLVLRQVHQNHRLLTLVYVGQAREDLSVDGLSLRECRVTEDMEEVKQFMDTFDTDVDTALDTPPGLWIGPLHNVTVVHLDDETELPEYLRPIVHFRKLRAQCKNHMRAIRRGVRERRLAKKAQKQAQKQANTALDSHSRSKRSLLSFRMPFTKWCGAHYDARTYGDLGGLVRLDHCCRQHDMHCPFFIKFMEEKYGLRNYNIGTINHCGCDERFKACLKLTKTGVADFVGDVFFNKMKTKCFDLTKRRVCVKRDGWFGLGTCTRYSTRQMAVLRHNVAYNY